MAERPIAALAALALLVASLQVGAAEPADAALDARVQHLTEELRCLVCQNQTIAESHAQLAIDLKAEVRSQLARGATEAEVKEFMVGRYGDFVLYRPPVRAATWLLWGGPALLLLAGLALLAAKLRRQAREGSDDDDEAVTDWQEGRA
ncbi:cytochrome c-type biogenesis protein [Derxia lacustris]|uniref:cytochrome c-type biogenesis protein n=1 Tax=Derxia lacustris TaxID=764842 RepID=UPI000A1764A2|nr:cytochrome c-type biogenesis protein [Derxia lacustris]